MTEAERLSRLRDLVVLDSAPEPLFDAIARMASQVCGVPIALMSLVDAERQWFKANVGLPGVNETPRDIAFCAHAIQSDALFEVPDAEADPRFGMNPLVTGAPDVRFYAGAPLIMPDGARIGTLCVIDRHARQLDAAQAEMLQSLAALASQALVMRRDLIIKALSVRSEFEKALADSEARHRAMVEDQSDLVLLARHGGEIVYANPAYARHVGRDAAALVGENMFDFVRPDDRAGSKQRIDGVFRSGDSASGEARMLGEGGDRWIGWVNRLQRDADGQVLLHSVGRDVTERKLAGLTLQELTGTLQSVMEAIPAMVAVIGTDQRVRMINSAYERWSGSARERIVGRPMQEVMGRLDYERSVPWIDRALAGESVSFDRDYPESGRSRSLEISYVPLWLNDGEVHGIVGIAQDITRHKQEEVRLLRLTQRDALTGLLNRSGFEQVLDAAVQDGHGDQLGLLYIDLDHFKPVNDQHGHAVGDRVLQVFAQRLTRLVRPTDRVARLGGDEFAIVLGGVRDIAGASTVAQKVIDAAGLLVEVGEIRLQVGASVGVAVGMAVGISASSAMNASADGEIQGWRGLVARADEALYRAKRSGRGRLAAGD